jgi:hypothetical protein
VVLIEVDRDQVNLFLLLAGLEELNQLVAQEAQVQVERRKAQEVLVVMELVVLVLLEVLVQVELFRVQEVDREVRIQVTQAMEGQVMPLLILVEVVLVVVIKIHRRVAVAVLGVLVIELEELDQIIMLVLATELV